MATATYQNLNLKIEKIQLSFFSRFINKISRFIQFALNYGLSAGVKLLDLLTKTKYGLRKHILGPFLSISIAEKMALTILFRFNAMADRRHSSVAARMPRFRIFRRLCSLFITAKMPSAHIFRFLIMYRYSGVLTLKSPL